MFRRPQILRAAMPIEETAWIVLNKHLVGSLGTIVGMLGLLWHESKDGLERRMAELTATVEQNRAELKAEIDALNSQMRNSLSSMATTTGAMDARAQFYRDIQGRSSAGVLDCAFGPCRLVRGLTNRMCNRN